MAKKTTRDLGDSPDDSGKSQEALKYGINYLLAIAIDDYDTIRKLSNCKKDVDDITDILTTKYTYSKDNFKKLYDQDATSENIITALDHYAGIVKPEDTLTILFSGHGENRNEIGFWIPVNATINKFNEYLSLSTVSDFLEPIKARHIFIISDACYSGLLFKKTTRSLDNAGAAESEPSRYALTAGRNQKVSDGIPGENSPFAEAVKKQLVSYEEDLLGAVTLSQNVLLEVDKMTKKGQTPRHSELDIRGNKSGQFYFHLKKGLDAEAHVNIGKLMIHLAENVHDPAIYRSALKHFEYAATQSRFSSIPLPEIQYWQGKAYLGCGELATAMDSFTQYLDQPSAGSSVQKTQVAKPEILADAFYQYIKTALMNQEPLAAEVRFREMETLFPQHPKFRALQDIFQTKEKDQARKKRVYALPIGINDYMYLQKFQGCVNDANLFTEMVQKVWEKTVAEVEIVAHLDHEATYAAIRKSLTRLEKEIQPEDIFVLFFAGMAWQVPGENDTQEYALLTADTPAKQTKKSPSLKINELHQSLMQMNTKNKFLIIDSNMSNDLLGKEGAGYEYTVMFGCDEGEMAHEAVFSGKTHGIFTYALANTVREAYEKGDWDFNLHNKIVQYIKDRNYNQTPLISGDITPLFMTDMEIKPEEEHRIFRDDKTPLTERDYRRLKAKEKNKSLHFWPVYKKMGEFLLTKKDIVSAADYFDTYATGDPTLHNTLAAVDLFDRLGYYDRALESLDWYSQQPEFEKNEVVLELIEKYKSKGQVEVFDYSNQYALLVGISQYKSLPPLKSAKKDAEYWKDCLIGDLGFPPENITLLTDAAATREIILTEFERHVQLSVDSPVLFYFAGYGTCYDVDNPVPDSAASRGIVSGGINYSDKKYIPAILSHEAGDGQTFDILFSELSELYTGNHLASIFDMGIDDIIGDRGLTPADDASAANPNEANAAPRLANLMQFRVGNATLLPGVMQAYDSPNKKEVWCVETEEGGILTTCVLDYLIKNQGNTIYLSEMVRAITARKIDCTEEKNSGVDLLSPVLLSLPDTALFHPYRLGRKEIDQLQKTPFSNLQNQLQQLSAATSLDFPDYQVNLSIVNALLGETEPALSMLAKAATDEGTEAKRLVKANYHLGRILVETSAPDDKENWSQAVNALRIASKTQPDFAPTYYYLGKAIHQLSTLEGRLEAAKAFVQYEKQGYPIGYREEVEAFLDSLDDSRLKNRRMEQGIIHLNNEELAEAEKCFREALQLGDTDAWYYIGEIYEKKDEFLPALGAYKNALNFKVTKEDLPFRIAHMFRKVVTNVDLIAEVLEGLKAYNSNEEILKNQATEVLVGEIEKLDKAMQESGLGWEKPRTR